MALDPTPSPSTRLRCTHTFAHVMEYVRVVHALAPNVATLALGSRSKQGFAKLWAKREAKSHTTYSRECEKV